VPRPPVAASAAHGRIPATHPLAKRAGNGSFAPARLGVLDRIWQTTIVATTAAAGGMDVAVFFTFWVLFPLVREDVRLTADNWMTNMLSVMDRGSAAHAPDQRRGRSRASASMSARAGVPAECRGG
jgi:hypothetical protein